MPASNVLWPVSLQRLTPWYPGQMGVPGTDSDRGLRMDSNGIVLWVDPNHVDANDARDGTNPDAPLATVAAALTKCRAYSGDVIAVMHNARWTYASAATIRQLPIQESVVVTTPGVRIVGVSSGSIGVPWVPTGDNTTCITIRAMDVTIEGFAFWNMGYNGATAILAEWGSTPPPVVVYYGENLVIRHCYFYHLAYGVQLDYTYNVHVEDCRFEGIGTAAIHNPSVYGEPDYSTFRNNVFIGCVSAINLPDCDYEVIERNRFLQNTAAIVILSGAHNQIHANTVEGTAAGANNMINLTGGSLNLVSGNYLSCSIAQYDTTCSDSTSGAWVNNHLTNGDQTLPPT